MDFELIITRHILEKKWEDRKETHYTPDTLLAKIKSEIAQWNIDHEENEELSFNLKKVLSQGETLGISTGDSATTDDRVG